MKEDVLKKIVASLKCGSCGKSYRDASIDIIEHEDEMWFIRVDCPACHARSLVAAIIREGEPPAVTDLTAGEVGKFQDAAAVGEDDLLEMHAFLKDFDGDLAGLFR